jgi:hypothetical protein
MEESEETKELLDVTPSTEKIRRRLRYDTFFFGAHTRLRRREETPIRVYTGFNLIVKAE